MFVRVRRWLIPPVLADEEQSRIASLFCLISLTLLVASILIALSSMFFGHIKAARALAIGAAGILGSFWLIQRGHLRSASLLVLLMFLGVLNYLLYAGDGIHDIAVVAYPVAIIIASLLLDKRAFVVYALLVALSLQGIIYGELNGLIVNKFSGFTLYADSVSVLVIVFITTVSARLMSDNITQNIARARSSQRTLAESNHELQCEIAERKRVEEALRESNHRLEETLAELKATQQQIVQQERLAAVGQLAAGIAHDFNNMLTSIIGYAGLVQMRPDIPQAAQADMARVVKQGQRAAHLVQQILDFSRKSIRQPQPLDLVPFLKEAVKFLERIIPETIHIRLEIEPVERLAQADPTQLQQVVTNLVVNARDAMPKGGELTLRLAGLTLEPGEEPPRPGLSPGEWIAFSVSDTGIGIPKEILPHIFEPFFTTRAPEGSGLGLAQVYGIVEQHEGCIDVESQVGQGTTLTIYLPALAMGEAALGEGVREDLPRGHGEKVLLVEDDPTVLKVGKAMLEHLGYRVLLARNGQQALTVYEEQRDEIALVLADMVMPKMDGLALFHALKAKAPDIQVVLITGYSLNEEAQAVLAQGIIDWLQKPMTINRLAQVVSRAVRRDVNGGAAPLVGPYDGRNPPPVIRSPGIDRVMR